MNTAIFVQLFLGLLVLAAAYCSPIIERSRAHKARLQSQRKLEITIAYGKASKAHYEAFDTYFAELGKDNPRPEKVCHLHQRVLETRAMQDSLYASLKTT